MGQVLGCLPTATMCATFAPALVELAHDMVNMMQYRPTLAESSPNSLDLAPNTSLGDAEQHELTPNLICPNPVQCWPNSATVGHHLPKSASIGQHRARCSRNQTRFVKLGKSAT